MHDSFAQRWVLVESASQKVRMALVPGNLSHHLFIAVLTIRVWAVSNQHKRLAIGLVILYVICWGSSVTAMLLFTSRQGADPLDVLHSS
jgi:hypothetical protein